MSSFFECRNNPVWMELHVIESEQYKVWKIKVLQKSCYMQYDPEFD